MSHLIAPSILSADFANIQRDVEMINRSAERHLIVLFTARCDPPRREPNRSDRYLPKVYCGILTGNVIIMNVDSEAEFPSVRISASKIDGVSKASAWRTNVPTNVMQKNL